MALPTLFANASSATGAQLDGDFAAVGAGLVIPCTCAGTNALTLTPGANYPTVSSYANFNLFSFNAAQTSTGAMTIQVGALPLLKLFLPGGSVQAAASAVAVGRLYIIGYQASLDSSAGGFVIVSSSGPPPTRQTIGLGSGTYTTPPGCTLLRIRMTGGGGGGGGNGGSGVGAGGNGVDTAFSTFTAGRGTGSGANGAGGGTGGSPAGAFGFVGANGAASSTAGAATEPGGCGGQTPFGGGGSGGVAGAGGGNAAGSTGSGGGGAGAIGASNATGGGGAGAYVEDLIASPAATYTYTVGTGGAAGAAGASGSSGGTGAAGIIIVDEFY